MYIKRVAERLDTLFRDPYMRPISCSVVRFPRGAGTAESIASDSLEVRHFSPSSYFLNNLTPTAKQQKQLPMAHSKLTSPFPVQLTEAIQWKPYGMSPGGYTYGGTLPERG